MGQDVIIAGGGVIGSAIAYFLKGWVGFQGSVLVVEKDPTYELSSTSRSAGGVRQQYVPAPFQLHLIYQVRELAYDRGHRTLTVAVRPRAAHGRVKTHGPFDVTATQCSKCAEYEPSLVTAVHLSFNTCVSGLPAFTMGSMASTMPSFRRGFSFFRST